MLVVALAIDSALAVDRFAGCREARYMEAFALDLVSSHGSVNFDLDEIGQRAVILFRQFLKFFLKFRIDAHHQTGGSCFSPRHKFVVPHFGGSCDLR